MMIFSMEMSVGRLVSIFHIDVKTKIWGFCEFKDTKDYLEINYLHSLLNTVKTIAIFSSECERSFSANVQWTI